MLFRVHQGKWFLIPPLTHTHDTHEDMLTRFCLRGCGKATLLGKERKRRRGRKVVWKREWNRGRVGCKTKNGKQRWSVFGVEGFE